MSASISFERPEQDWVGNSGRFEIILALALGHCADPAKVETLRQEVFENALITHMITISDFPRSEQEEFLLALKKAAEMLRNGTVPEEVSYNKELGEDIALTCDEIAGSLQNSLET